MWGGGEIQIVMIMITMIVMILMMMVVIIMTMKMMMMMKIIKYHENIAFELQDPLTDWFRKKVLTPSLKYVLCVFGWEAVKVKVNLHYDQRELIEILIKWANLCNFLSCLKSLCWWYFVFVLDFSFLNISLLLQRKASIAWGDAIKSKQRNQELQDVGTKQQKVHACWRWR